MVSNRGGRDNAVKRFMRNWWNVVDSTRVDQGNRGDGLQGFYDVDRDGAQLLDLESQLRREYTIWQRRKWPTQMQGKLDLEFLYFSGYVFQGVVSQRLIVKHMETR